MNSIDLIAERFSDSGGEFRDSEKASEYAESMLPSGAWPDLDYEGEKLPFWKCITHFARLNYLAYSGKYDDKVIAGLEFWYQKKRTDPNWWWNDIGIQIDLAFCGVLFKDKLYPELKKKVAETFNDSVAERWTGTNRFWLAQNVIVRGIITGDAGLIRRGKKYLEDTIYISDTYEEGIQPDFAFAQHGPQLYNNGYGRALVIDACTWINIFAGTEFAFPTEKTDIITSLLLDGHGRMCFCDVPDHNSIGRDLVRGFKGRDTRMRGFLPSIEVLKKVSPRRKELEELEAYIKGDSRVFERAKMFSSLDIMTANMRGGYASVRFGSDKVLGGDVVGGKIINGEDRFSGFRGCFTSQYMVNGFEYDRIFPVWNWAFLPGVSCPETELPTERGAVMKSTFAGGASDGKNGVCAIDLNEDFSNDSETVVFGGKKACFFINGEIIHLGCGLYSETTLNTTVNQCAFCGSFIVDGKKYGFGSVSGAEKYILHDGIAYIFPKAADVRISAEHREGTWNRITEMPETRAAEKDVFTAYIPQKDSKSYEYAVLLNADEAEAEGYSFPDFVNTEKVQAVKRGDLVCAVFYEPAEAVIGNTVISAQEPCFVVGDVKKVQNAKRQGIS